MPIYEPDLSFVDMQKAQYNFVCAECGGILSVAWSADHNCYVLRCGNLLEHSLIKQKDRDLEILEIRNKLKGAPLPMETTALQKLDPKQMLERVNEARFPDKLTAVDRQLIAKVAIEYGLDPLFGELMIYQGRPYITIDARRRKAQETGQLDGISARPATKEEKGARGVSPEDYLFVAEVWRIGGSHPYTGVGRVTKAEINRAIAQAKSHGSQEDALPIVKDPAAQAEKRAEAQALRRAFHIPLPSFEEIVEGEFEEVTPKKEATSSKSSPPKAQTDTERPPQAGTATEPQKKKIWKDANAMGYKGNEVHEICERKFGKKSVHELTVAEASTLIDMIAKGEGGPAPDAPQAERDAAELWPGGEE